VRCSTLFASRCVAHIAGNALALGPPRALLLLQLLLLLRRRLLLLPLCRLRGAGGRLLAASATKLELLLLGGAALQCGVLRQQRHLCAHVRPQALQAGLDDLQAALQQRDAPARPQPDVVCIVCMRMYSFCGVRCVHAHVLHLTIHAQGICAQHAGGACTRLTHAAGCSSPRVARVPRLHLPAVLSQLLLPCLSGCRGWRQRGAAPACQACGLAWR
jgi:hypothetical protein